VSGVWEAETRRTGSPASAAAGGQALHPDETAKRNAESTGQTVLLQTRPMKLVR